MKHFLFFFFFFPAYRIILLPKTLSRMPGDTGWSSVVPRVLSGITRERAGTLGLPGKEGN